MTFAGWTSPCAIGRSGMKVLKREGDGATPLGRYGLRRVFHRAERERRPAGRLPSRALRPDDGWCDDPQDGRYNCLVRLPFHSGHERMWRDDSLYDLVVVLSHNERPRVRGLGSAVFLHVARPGLSPTEGCVAVQKPTLRRLLALCGPDSTIEIV
jgi:L,D-peptidoglycan transpeptidase YkuD (ErfK/YbiS/YcfS/YnhG family)